MITDAPTHHPDPADLSVAVVICAYTAQRWELLREAVASVEAQETGGRVQLVLVIDHQDELLARCRTEWPQHLVIPNAHRQGLSGARNTGVAATDADVVAFLDDDARAHPGWLRALVAPFADPGVGGVGGAVEPRWLASTPAWFPPEFRWVVGCSYTGQPTAPADIRNPIGANMAMRRSVVEAVGGFREDLGRVGTIPLGCEETELSIRAGRAGMRVRFQPDAVVDHAVPAERTRFAYFRRRCYAEGVSKAMVSALAGTDAALSAERSYVTRTLPRGIADAVRTAVTGPSRRAGLVRAAAIPAGLACTAAGYARGRVQLARQTA